MLHVTVTGTSQAPNLQLVHDDHSSFVMVSRPDLPNNRYVLYQKYSENFPSEAHCEAATDDNDANWLCRDGLNGNLISGSVTPNFNTYVISGIGNGTMPGLSEVLTNIRCSDSENSGSKSCEVIINDFTSVTKVYCSNKNNPASCSYVTYDEDGSQSTCYGKAANYIDGECVANKKGSYMKSYDEEGNLTEYLCNNYTTGSGCYALGQEQYDVNGRHLAAQNRYCEEWNSNGECIGYKQGQGNNHFGIFSENHKMWVRADCQEVDINGICNSYKGGRIEEWDYDENGTTLVYHDNTCSSLSMDLVCSSYSNYKTKTYSYKKLPRSGAYRRLRQTRRTAERLEHRFGILPLLAGTPRKRDLGLQDGRAHILQRFAHFQGRTRRKRARGSPLVRQIPCRPRKRRLARNAPQTAGTHPVRNAARETHRPQFCAGLLACTLYT